MAGVSLRDQPGRVNSMAKKKVKPVGRPTKYKPTCPQKVYDYIKQCNEIEEGKERVLPTRADIALLFHVSLATIDTWGKGHTEFLVALEELKHSQQSHLINRCMNGTGNATIGKMLLSANHGMSERTEVEHGVSDGLSSLMKEIGSAGVGLPIKKV